MMTVQIKCVTLSAIFYGIQYDFCFHNSKTIITTVDVNNYCCGLAHKSLSYYVPTAGFCLLSRNTCKHLFPLVRRLLVTQIYSMHTFQLVAEMIYASIFKLHCHRCRCFLLLSTFVSTLGFQG